MGYVTRDIYAKPLEEPHMADVMRQKYRVLSDEEKEDLRAVKEKAVILYDHIAGLPATRETALAKTKVEEAVMWAVKPITG